MKKNLFIIPIILLICPALLFSGETSPADLWIQEQLNLQYSDKTIAPGRKNADFSFCSDDLDYFETHREYLFHALLYGRDAHDIRNLYERGVFYGLKPSKLPLFVFPNAFKILERETISVKDILLYYLLKMRRSQDNGMNIILTVNKNALKEAEIWEKQRSEMNNFPLFGIPVVLKANIGTTDGQPTSAGAKALEDSHCIKNAFIVERIRESGGIILAKTNLSEWANYMAENSANGFSAIGGQTRNPYGEFDVGGSSSGSAVAVALGLAPMAIGTETSGSIVYPASQNSVVGLKPTVGLVSRDCIIPIANAQDTAGPMTGSVRDAALLLSVIAGYDESDPKTSICREILTEYPVSAEGEQPLQGIRLGLVSNRSMRHYYHREEEADMQMRIAGELSRAGAIVMFIEMDETIYEKLDVLSVFSYQFKEGVNNYLNNFADEQSVRALSDIIAFNRKKPEERMPLGQELLEESDSNEFTEDEISALVTSNRAEARKLIDTMIKENDLDLLFSLSNHLSYIYSAAGYPAICVPAGYKSSGEPIGVTFVGSLGDERLLMEVALGYEQETRHRRQAKAKSGSFETYPQ